MLDYRVWECIIYISGETESSSISRQRGSLHFHTCDTHAWIIGSGNNTSQKVDCQKVASLKVLLRLDWDHFVMVCLESLGSHFHSVFRKVPLHTINLCTTIYGSHTTKTAGWACPIVTS